jgi:predicted esterase
LTPERWKRVAEVFHAALEKPVDDREAFLEEACGQDSGLRSTVERLLAARSAAGDFLSEPVRLEDDGQTSNAAAVRSGRLVPGTRLGPYEVVSFLGAGGMGEVYKGRDTRLGRTVAIKVLPADAETNANLRRRFEREARAISHLSHPHICALYDVGQHDRSSFLVMEYLEGETLAERLRRGPLSLPEALGYARQIAGALAEAHEHDVVHRDLKPANVVLTKKGAKLLDFGIAKLLGDAMSEESPTVTATSLTGEASIVGTPQYMAPEQLEGRAADARTDVFAFGVVLYEMVTGRKAFESPSDAGLIAAILTGEPRRLRDVRSDVPGQIERIVARCLQKEPSKRYPSAVEVHRDLQDSVMPGATAPARWPFTRRDRLAGAVVLIALLAGALGVWTFVLRAQAETERKATVAEMERLVDLGRFVEVWRLGRAALQRWPGDAQLEHPMSVTTQPVTIATDPSGAEVAFKAYEDVSGEWLLLGTTPLKAVPAPVGQLRWRITKAGFEPLEARIEVGAPAAAAGRPDVDARPIRLRPAGGAGAAMVFVPGSQHGGVELTDYWIDQTEVKNREFKAFVDRAGYQDSKLWTHLGREVSRLHDREGGVAAFRDRTGRPGPSTWELGTYPEGKGDHPVSGVNWFEAVAYCRSVGKTLPTVFHWKRAFGETYFVEVLTLGNFSGRGPEDTRELKEVGPYGTYGMAGNVKEWVWNEFERRRYILGGAWNEPVYMAVDDDARPPLDRAETHGFRCIKENAPSGALAYAPYGAGPQPTRDLTKEKPVDAAAFEVFQRFYSYDRTSLDPRIERTEVAAHWRRERVSFAAAYGGERVVANILLPKHAAPPYQAVIWFPGGYAVDLRSSERELVFSYYFDFLPRSGRALVYPVYKGTYERQVLRAGEEAGASQRRDLVVQWSKDLGRTIDYLESRSDFDSDKLAYYGFSMGAGMALPAVALEPRLEAVILLSGGLYEEAVPEIAPLNFLPRIKVPVLLLAGRNDFYFPVESSQRPLFELLGTPGAHKRHVVFENAGHVPPRVDVIREILDWLDRYLGPPRM